MSRIKKIKQKTPSGFVDIAIGADAENIDVKKTPSGTSSRLSQIIPTLVYLDSDVPATTSARGLVGEMTSVTKTLTDLDIVDNLVTEDEKLVLSAKQGYELMKLIKDLQDRVSALEGE